MGVINFYNKNELPKNGSSGQVLSLNDENKPEWVDPTAEIDIDDHISDSSTNPVQNKVIKEYVDTLDSAYDHSRAVNDHNIAVADHTASEAATTAANTAAAAADAARESIQDDLAALGQKVDDLDVVVKGKCSKTFHTQYTGTAVTLTKISLKGGRPYKFTFDTQDSITGIAYGLKNPEDNTYIKSLDGINSFPATKTYTPTKDYEEALLVITINPSSTYIDLSVTIEAESLSTPVPFLNPAMEKLFPVANKYINPSTGAETSLTNYRATDFIEIDKTVDIKAYGLSGNVGKIVFYDENKTYISSVSATYSQSPVVCAIADIPATAKYIRCSSLVDANFAPLIQCVSFIGYDGRFGKSDSEIVKLKGSGTWIPSAFVNQDFTNGLTGWTKSSHVTNSGKVLTIKYNGTQTPYIGQSISVAKGYDYYFIFKGTISDFNSLADGLRLFMTGNRMGSKLLPISGNGLIEMESILHEPDDITDPVSRLLYMSFSYPGGTTIPGMTSGDTILKITMDYFAVIPIPHYNRLTHAQMSLIGKNGGIYAVLNQPINKIWYAVGDSITVQGNYAQNAWWWLTARMIGAKSITTIAAGGKSLSKPGSSSNPAMCDDSFLATIPADAELVTIMGGTNDWGNSHPIGTIDSADDTTFCGAINHIIDYLAENRPRARVVFITPIYGEQITTPSGWTDIHTNSVGKTISDYMAAMAQVCDYRGFPCIHLGQKCGWTHGNVANFLKSDGAYIHPNDYGGFRMASIITHGLLEIAPLLDDEKCINP